MHGWHDYIIPPIGCAAQSMGRMHICDRGSIIAEYRHVNLISENRMVLQLQNHPIFIG